MPDTNPNAELNKRLKDCQTLYAVSEEFIVNYNRINISEYELSYLHNIFNIIISIYGSINRIETLSKQIILNKAIESVPTKSLRFYIEKIAPQKLHIEKIALDLYSIFFESEEEPYDQEKPSDSIWDVFVAGYDYWDMAQDGTFTRDQLDNVDLLLHASFFKPDEWVNNLKELQPIMGDQTKKVTHSSRIRIRELYHSYILGNYLSTIALARSILEYSLIDRASNIGIEVTHPRFPNRNKPLRQIINDAAEHLPVSYRLHMETIVDAGNDALHPKQKEKLYLHPSFLRDRAKSCLESTRLIVQKLYLDM